MSTMVKGQTATADREIIISRIMAAPRDLVWRAWTDPAHISHWWGPNGFSTSTKEFNFKSGGLWRFTMHGPDGRDYPNRIVFGEIAEKERLTYKHAGEGDLDDVKFESTVTFEAIDGKTKVTLHMVFPTAQERDHVVKEFGAIEGGQQTLERLENFVKTSLI